MNKTVYQEGKMKNGRSLKFWAVAAAIVAVFVFVASALVDPIPLSQSRPKSEKVCPITFHLDPVTPLQTNFAAAIEKTNADLAKQLSGLRTLIIQTNPDDLKLRLAEFARTCQEIFDKTYLKKPVLWAEDGKTYVGWTAITNFLAALMPSTTYIVPQSVDVYLEYLQLKSAKYAALNGGIKDLKDLADEIDFLASIRTALAYAPYDDPIRVGNESPIPHRKVCDPIF